MEMSIEDFILKNDSLIKFFVNFYYNKVCEFGIEFDDLYQAGVLSLIENYYNYDSTKASISTFASLNIKYGICDYINKNICITYVPKIIMVISSNFNKKRRDFYLLNGRDMTKDEMIYFLQNDCYTSDYVINENFLSMLLKIENYHLINQKCSLYDEVMNVSLDEENIDYIEDLLISDYSLEDEVTNSVLVENIISYIETNFDDKSIQIFKEYFGFSKDSLDATVRKLGKKYDCCPQGISCINKKIIKKVRKNFGISE